MHSTNRHRLTDLPVWMVLSTTALWYTRKTTLKTNFDGEKPAHPKTVPEVAEDAANSSNAFELILFFDTKMHSIKNSKSTSNWLQ